MNDARLEQDLEKLDFSGIHPVKERLYQQLLNMHRLENSAKRDLWAGNRMSDEEMEWAAAAGNPALQGRKDKQRGDA